MSTILCTYPRSGSRYLSGFLVKNTDLDFARSHNADDAKKHLNVITTIRKPEECFKSQITLEFEFQKLLPPSNNVNSHLKDEENKLDLKKSLDHCISMYTKFYNNILEYNPIILDYEKILNKEELLGYVKAIAEKVNFNIKEDIDYDFKVLGSYSDMDEEIFLHAKKSEKYKEVSEFVDNYDIEQVKTIYKEIISLI